MKRTALLLSLLLFTAASTLPGQSSSPATPKTATKKAELPRKPFSQIALGGGMSLMGVNLQAATNVNRYLNLRGSGNLFNYSASNISTNGFNLNGKVNMATAGVALDYYPFPSHGFRLSPGALFYNQNNISASGSPTVGSSITLNHQDFYAEAANPLSVSANLGLNTHQQAFTLTTGWGNMIPRKNQNTLFGHLSFPVELGAAFTGVPSLNMNLTGFACTNQADAATNGPSCVNMATNAQAQTDLNSQLNTWRSDLNPLKVYPIFSFGIAYSFDLRQP